MKYVTLRFPGSLHLSELGKLNISIMAMLLSSLLLCCCVTGCGDSEPTPEEMEQARQRQIEKEKQQREKTIQDNLRNAQLSPPPTSELSNFAEALKYLEPVEHYK